MKEMTIKNLGRSKKSWKFLDGSIRTVAILESVIIGRGIYLPGWRWSEHVGKMTGKSSQAHIGYIVSGRMCLQKAGGKKEPVGPGDAFEIGPGHDAWVVGNKPCIALDFETLSKK